MRNILAVCTFSVFVGGCAYGDYYDLQQDMENNDFLAKPTIPTSLFGSYTGTIRQFLSTYTFDLDGTGFNCTLMTAGQAPLIHKLKIVEAAEEKFVVMSQTGQKYSIVKQKDDSLHLAGYGVEAKLLPDPDLELASVQCGQALRKLVN